MARGIRSSPNCPLYKCTPLAGSWIVLEKMKQCMYWFFSCANIQMMHHPRSVVSNFSYTSRIVWIHEEIIRNIPIAYFPVQVLTMVTITSHILNRKTHAFCFLLVQKVSECWAVRMFGGKQSVAIGLGLFKMSWTVNEVNNFACYFLVCLTHLNI